MAPKKAKVKEEKPPEETKKTSVKLAEAVIQTPIDVSFFKKEDVKPTFDEQWFDDPIEGEEAIRMAMLLQQKIEAKALPIRTWLEKNIVPLLLQALGALVAHRPSNPCEYLAAHLIKYNPLKDTYPEDEPKPKKCIEEEIESDDEDDPCGCKRIQKKDNIVPSDDSPESKQPPELAASQVAKKAIISADAKKSTISPDVQRSSIIAKEKSASQQKLSK